MLLFYGLGNDDPKYLNTKHNAGRLVLESMASSMGLNFTKQNRVYLAQTKQDSEPVWLVLPTGYMNNSGEPLVDIIKYFKIDCQNENFRLVILQDDSDQIFGNQKLTIGGGSAGHHGINSIYKLSLGINLPTDHIWRLKIGIRPEGNRSKSETFVLSPLSQKERDHFQSVGGHCHKLLSDFTRLDINKLQTAINSYKLPIESKSS